MNNFKEIDEQNTIQIITNINKDNNDLKKDDCLDTISENDIFLTGQKRSKGIYGSATKKQINELREEGIETQIFPWIEDNNN